MTRILTPYEYIIKLISAYPSLYAAPTREAAIFKIMDQIFNTIGNGIEFENFVGDEINEDVMAAAQKWFSCSNAAYGYYQVDTYKGFERPIGDSIVVHGSEKHLHPDIVYWVNFECNQPRDPYPNFQKRYSLVWKPSFKKLGIEWRNIAIWFYEECRDYFMDVDRVKSYHTSFPKKTEKETNRLISDYKKRITDKKMYPDNVAITKAYGVKFVGDPENDSDVAAFIQRRWDKERADIMIFIDKTLTMLKEGNNHE